MAVRSLDQTTARLSMQPATPLYPEYLQLATESEATLVWWRMINFADGCSLQLLCEHLISRSALDMSGNLAKARVQRKC
jgi:hypothetical protein